MSIQSERVKNWRRRTKERIVESMGGKCVACGYSKCANSLDCHHIDPGTKDFSIGHIRANPQAWETVVNELRKCVLLCRNCHGELHAGFTIIPFDAASFDESFANYKLPANIPTHPCPVCLKEIPNTKRSCSLVCSGKLNRKVDWDNIDIPALLLRHTSICSAASELDVSDVALHKRMKKLGLK